MELVLMLVTLLPIMVITIIMPYITRKTESFGVSIPEESYYHEELLSMRKSYVIQTSIFSIILLIFSIVSLSVFDDPWKRNTILFSVIIFLCGSFLIYLLFHRQMKLLKDKQNWKKTKSYAITIDTHFHMQKKTYSDIWFLIPLTISICTIIVSIIFYKKIPEKIPMHFDYNGMVTDWSNKSVLSVFQLPAIQLFLTGLLLFINRTISKSKQQIDSANPEKSMAQNLIFRRRWSAFIIITSVLIVLLFFSIQLSYIIDMNMKWIESSSLGVTGVIVLGAIFLSIKTGQGGSRVNRKQGKNELLTNYDDDRYWKLGIFYFNPNDPSIWIEKRFGSGWTINMARPIAWIFLFIIILIPIIISILTKI
jgi:uncharacterized membrane protein